MLVNLEQRHETDPRSKDWEKSGAFLDNPRAQLVHRIRRVTTHRVYREPHISVEAWCGNCFTSLKPDAIVEQYSGLKLLCIRCETAAVGNGLDSADNINGTHMHTGRLQPIKMCCREEMEAN